MSTAGKVLSILVALMTVAAVVLLSMISQLNRNYGRAIEQEEGRLTEAQEQIRELEQNVYALDQKIESARAITANELELQRTLNEDLRNRVTLLTETLVRVQQRLEKGQELIAAENAMLDTRAREIERFRDEINQTNAEVDDLAGQVAEKSDSLQGLRDEFRTLLAENQQLLERVGTGRASSVGSAE